MKRSLVFAVPLFAAILTSLHCGGDDATNASPKADGGTAGADGGNVVQTPDNPLVPATKIDLLFAVDNSASMAAKQALLASSLKGFLTTLTGKAADVHFGIVSSSLGNQGGDVCLEDATHTRTNMHGHLVNTDATGKVIAGAESGFLSFGPGGDVAAFEKAASDMVVGVGEGGCGFEAQLESLYRFVAQPDPPSSTSGTPGQPVTFGATDDALLAQRKAFFRPDSAVAIVMLTDEDDSTVDPRAAQGVGWQFELRNFPGSQVKRGTAAQGTTAARGSSECATTPESADCNSCGFAALCNPSDAACQRLATDTNCKTSGTTGKSGAGYDGFYAPDADDLNIRFYDMKERFGLDPQFPVDRYVQMLTSFKVPNLTSEHDSVGTYVQATTCTNPLFAASLPGSSQEELCNLPAGTRSRQLVYFQLIGGVVPQLVTPTPNWMAILGVNPDGFDLTGIDPHMLQSPDPRPGLDAGGSSTLPRGQNGTDPINGREWDTQKRDLQFACTFSLPTPIDCSDPSVPCSCTDDPVGGAPANPPLCAPDGSATQIRGAAYPTIRELRVVKGLGDRGLVDSICSYDPQSGYSLDALAAKLTGVLK